MAARIRSVVLQSDNSTLIALEALPDYAPRNAKHSVVSAKAARDKVQTAHARIQRLRAELAAALDAAAVDESDYHEIITGAKTEVLAQYGPNSDEYASLGLKKKTEHKRPVRKTKTT